MWFAVGPALSGLGLEGSPRPCSQCGRRAGETSPAGGSPGVSVLTHGAMALRKEYGWAEGHTTLQATARQMATRRRGCQNRIRFFSNITLSGRDYSFNSDGYLSNPVLDVISYTEGKGWEEVGTWQNGVLDLIIQPFSRYGSFLKPLDDTQHLKVVTLEERPFVIVEPADPGTNSCIRDSVPCRLPLNTTNVPVDEKSSDSTAAKASALSVSKRLAKSGLSL
ncbi:glutamate receptor ionotropic, NMDA 2D-like [Salvelinus sp. IW2-2015]|uniref:glutamate receptor ionotropic, NMDA 2D-like n=1 Tax=Salvelinus sp. IW2-2015 TaxID=2691554 RepID=UPI0038D3D25C